MEVEILFLEKKKIATDSTTFFSALGKQGRKKGTPKILKNRNVSYRMSTRCDARLGRIYPDFTEDRLHQFFDGSRF
jgi:23S rRNA maturation mini-RNase III